MTARIIAVVLATALVVGLVPVAPSARAQPSEDFPVPGGWFYTQATARSGFGYSVLDDAEAPMWTEYRRLGGAPMLGHPVSRRYFGADGFLYQAFERFILQWRPDEQRAVFANVFEQFTDAGLDGWLVSRGIPRPAAPRPGSFEQDAQRRMGLLTEVRFLGFYLLNPRTHQPWDFFEQAWELYGLPQSGPERVRHGAGAPGLWPFIAQRFQKTAFQLWLEDAHGVPAGAITIVAAGTLAREAGLIPLTAAVPEPPPTTTPWLIGQPQLAGVPVELLGQETRHFAIAGAGFLPGESVTVSLARVEEPEFTLSLSATARADGTFVTEGDALLGTYDVTARGDTSGATVRDSLVLQ